MRKSSYEEKRNERYEVKRNECQGDLIDEVTGV